MTDDLHQREQRPIWDEAHTWKNIDWKERAEQAAAEAEQLRAELKRRITAEAEALADQTLMKGLTVEKGKLELNLIPPREIVAVWVEAAPEMLGDATNYVEMEFKLAGEVERFAFGLQRVGKLTPHEARQQAEAERNELRDLVRELAESSPCQYDHDDQCQEHALHDRPCPHGRAQELLAGEET